MTRVVSSPFQKPFHAVAVRLQDTPIVSVRNSCLAFAEPPDRINRIFDSNSFDSNPLSRQWEFRGIIPVEILGKVKWDLLTELEGKLVVV